MRKIYNSLVVSTIFAMKAGAFSDIWKSMTLFILTICFMLNLLSVWMIIDHFCCPGFTKFLAFDFISSDYYNGLIYLLVYFFIPPFIINYLLIFRRKKYEILLINYPQAKSKRLFFIHFMGSLGLSYICLMLVI